MIQNPATGAGACASSSGSSRRSLLHPLSLPNLKLGSHHPSSSSSSVFLRSTSIFGSRNGTRNSSSSSSNWNRPLFLQATAKIAGAGGISDNNISFDSKPANSTASVLYLGALFGLWYLFNVYFSIYNKQVSTLYQTFICFSILFKFLHSFVCQSSSNSFFKFLQFIYFFFPTFICLSIQLKFLQVLNVYPFPLTISAFHFGIGTLFVLAMWLTNLYKKPNISSSQVCVM